MRTTLDIDPETISLIRKYAEESHVSLDQAASELVHRGAENLPKPLLKNGWVIFESATGDPVLSIDTLKGSAAAEYDEEYRLAFSPRR